MRKHLFLSLFLATSLLNVAAAGIPEFCGPSGSLKSISSLQSGNWSEPATWLPARVPTADDIVQITAGQTVVYDKVSDASVKTTCVQGVLKFRTDINTRLKVGTLMVEKEGSLEVGTAMSPVQSSVLAEIIITDRPIDPAFDPEQFGTGLIALGKVTMHGDVKKPAFIRLTAEPMAGVTALNLEQEPTGWKRDDRVVLPDSRQLADFENGVNFSPQWEELTLSGVNSTQVTLTSALRFKHPGSRDKDGRIDFLPHVVNLTRNVVIKSENPNGTRGHVMFTGRAEVDIRYVCFRDLGRTRFDFLDSSNPDGTHIGTNQIGRYPIHMHHLHGPVSSSSDDQFTLIGNAVDQGSANHRFKWGIAIHNSHYGFVQDNAVYNAGGAGIVGEDGSESFNVIEGNIVVRVAGAGGRGDERMNVNPVDLGYDGVGFWFRGINNRFRNNVAASTFVNYGWKFFSDKLVTVNIPNFKGADTTVPGQFTTVPARDIAMPEFRGNEGYGMGAGATFWSVGTMNHLPSSIVGESVVQDFRLWNFSGYGFFNYEMNRMTFDGLVIRAGNPQYAWAAWEGSDYFCNNVKIRNADIQGTRIGISPSTFGGSGTTLTVEDSLIVAMEKGMEMRTPWTSGGWANDIPPRTVITKNVKMLPWPNSPGPWNSYRMWATHTPVSNAVVSDRLFVYDYNQTPGANYRVYYKEQRPDFIIPQSILLGVLDRSSLTGSPEPNLTNAQNWDKYLAWDPQHPLGQLKTDASSPGLAIAGAVAPCQDGACSNAEKLLDVDGLVFKDNLPPFLSLLSPRANSVVSIPTAELTATFATFGNLANVAHAWLKLDSGPNVQATSLSGSHKFSSVSVGPHTLLGWLTNSSGSTIPGSETLIDFRTTLNRPPVVTLGPAQTAAMGQALRLHATVTDSESSPAALSILWSKLSGVGNVVFANPLNADTTAVFSSVGNYVLRCTASDGELSGSTDLSVTVNGAGGGGSSISVPTGKTQGVVIPSRNQPASIDCGDENSTVTIYDGRDNVVAKLSSERGPILWHGKNKDGKRCASGSHVGRCGNGTLIKLTVIN